VVTRPTSPLADVDERGYLGAAEWLTADDASRVVEVLDRVQADPEAQGRLQHWVRHHFGDTTPGAATQRFEDAVARLVARRDEFAARYPHPPRAVGETDSPDTGDDGL
jgi:hypothetical protein